MLNQTAGVKPFTHVSLPRELYAIAVLGIVILSVRLSVTGMLCDETKQHTAHILIQLERAIILVEPILHINAD